MQRTRMTRVGLANGVDRERADRVDCKLVVGVGNKRHFRVVVVERKAKNGRPTL